MSFRRGEVMTKENKKTEYKCLKCCNVLSQETAPCVCTNCGNPYVVRLNEEESVNEENDIND